MTAAAAIAVLVLLVVPFADSMWPVVPGLDAAWCALVLVCDCLTALLLYGLYRSGRDPRMMVLTTAYAWSALTVVVLAFAIPGVIFTDPMFADTANSVAWIWVSRHVGPPILIGLALAPWPRGWERRTLESEGETEATRVRIHRRIKISGVVALLAGPVWIGIDVTYFPEVLPSIVVGDVLQLTPLTIAVVLATNLLAVVAAIVGLARRNEGFGVEIWAIAAVVALCGDVVFVAMSTEAWSVPWYGARLLGMTASVMVPVSILVATWRRHQRVMAGAHDLEKQVDLLLESQRLRDHLSAVVSHDMRTPLAGLHGYLEVLNEDPGLNPEQVRQMHARSLVLSKRLTLLTEDLLAATTAEQGDLVVNPSTLDLWEQLAECETSFPDLDLRIVCPRDVPVHADPLRLQQILTNLIRNAQMHGAEPVIVEVRPAAGVVTIRVTDAGDGVPETFIPRLFERYSHGARTTGGAGIGLSVVHDLVQAHHGTIRYDLTDPAFIVTLPMAANTSEVPVGRVLTAPVRRPSPVEL